MTNLAVQPFPASPSASKPAHYRLSNETWELILKEYREGATDPLASALSVVDRKLVASVGPVPKGSLTWPVDTLKWKIWMTVRPAIIAAAFAGLLSITAQPASAQQAQEFPAGTMTTEQWIAHLAALAAEADKPRIDAVGSGGAGSPSGGGGQTEDNADNSNPEENDGPARDQFTLEDYSDRLQREMEIRRKRDIEHVREEAEREAARRAQCVLAGEDRRQMMIDAVNQQYELSMQSAYQGSGPPSAAVIRGIVEARDAALASLVGQACLPSQFR